ncbi:hypothetical protein ED28_08125 [[Pantoea] beijingensis]|uniref:Spore coat protein U/FanG domain-containing protein n=1 Tax=[Pantoea] beijingensis TaxID=1324864 RepID=A0A443IE70_9GAMM|nr:spore coat protein U domain-containing protein [[Pantoea] beijingensis]RWR02337.1 hypothetical protein ED28_08125 [[Pantoea] beijingensis]
MNLLQRLLRVLTALLLLLVGMQSALADCTSTSGAADFGTPTSFAVGSTPQQVTAGSGFVCTGSLLSLLSTNTVTATIVSTTNASGSVARLFSAANNEYLPYIICQDSACATPVNVGSSVTWRSTSLLGLLGLFNGSGGSLPLYLKTTAGANLKAGTYTDNITINWSYHICFVGVAGLCIYTDGTATTNIAVTMNIMNYCYIDNAPDVNFGSAAFPAAFARVTGNALSVRCTRGANYNVNLTSSNPLSTQYRQMSATINGTNRYLQYQLFKADTTVWGPTNSYSAEGTGLSQNIGYTATVNPTQTNVPSGSYSDTVTVTVAY